MLSVSAMSGGQGNYYAQLAREDYYLAGGEPLGMWLGRGAERLGLGGEVDSALFHRVFQGFGPSGDPLVQNAGAVGRKPGWDLTFSVPKSVSVLWSQLEGELGLEIRASQAEAVEAAMRYLQDVALFTRRGRGGHIHEKADLVAAAFEHGTSRAQDPQLHTHVLLLNLGIRGDGSTGSLTSRELYEHKMAAGAVYRAELAHQLQRRLGLEIKHVKSWFEIAGVPATLIQEFSKRRAEIESRLKDLELASAKASEIAALDTRSAKPDTARSELFPKWRAIGSEFGFGPEAAQALIHDPVRLSREPKEIACALSITRALALITEQHSYFPEREFVRRVAELGTGSGVSVGTLIEAGRTHLEKEAVHLGVQAGYRQFTTTEMLALEAKLLEAIERLAQKPGPQVTLDLKLPEQINAEQVAAVEHITRAEGMVKVVTGMAGTGKTTMLRTAAEAWHREEISVIGVSLAGKAARGLQEGAGIKSFTIAKLLMELEKPNPIPTPQVLVLDEAGMVGTRQLLRLVEHCEAKEIKLGLVGDGKQLQPIEAGGPFPAIAARYGEARLTSIVRQHEVWSRDVVHAVAEGRADDALREFAERGLLSICPTRREARAALLESWRLEGTKNPEDHLILTGSNEEAGLINREIQALRRQDHSIPSIFVSVGNVDLYPGDRVLFTKNSRLLGVQNGGLGTVTDVVPLFDQIRVKLDSGRAVWFDAAAYSDLKLGYAVTTHKAQGLTARNAYILSDPCMQDLHLSYVQISRARETTRIFAASEDLQCGDLRIAELTQLSKSMSRDRSKRLAIDLLLENTDDLQHELRAHNPTRELRFSM